MRKVTWNLLVSLFVVGIVWATGLVQAAPAPERPKPEPKPEWTTDLNKMKLPQAPVVGKVFGTDFKVETVEFQNTGALILKDGPNTIFIFLPAKMPGDLEGKSFEFGTDEVPGQFRASVHVHVHRPILKAEAFTKGLAMKVQFGKEKDAKLPAKIYVSLPDEGKSFFAGTFTLEVK